MFEYFEDEPSLALIVIPFSFFEFIFGGLSIPALPPEAQSIIDTTLEYMLSMVGIVGLFIDWDYVIILIPFLIAIINFERIWDFIMFILRKIPFLGIE